jgi:sulfonate transport system permease protein
MKRFGGLLFLFAIGIVLEIASDLHAISPAVFAPPHETLAALVAQFQTGSVWQPLGATIRHMLVGWISACVAGVGLGALVGLTAAGRAYVAPTLEFLRPLPASAIAPIGVLFIGRNDAMIVCVIVFGAIWPVLLASIHGFTSVDSRLTEVARALKLTRLQAFVMIALPSALPEILAGARVAIALALILAVVGEILASVGGLGDALNLAERSYRTAEMYAGVLLIGIIGVSANAALERCEAYLLRWRPAPAHF